MMRYNGCCWIVQRSVWIVSLQCNAESALAWLGFGSYSSVPLAPPSWTPQPQHQSGCSHARSAQSQQPHALQTTTTTSHCSKHHVMKGHASAATSCVVAAIFSKPTRAPQAAADSVRTNACEQMLVIACEFVYRRAPSRSQYVSPIVRPSHPVRRESRGRWRWRGLMYRGHHGEAPVDQRERKTRREGAEDIG